MNKIETRRVDELRPHDKNSGIYNDTADQALVESVAHKGILNPLIITQDNRIISGHRRLDAAKQCDLPKVPVTVFESDDELEIRRAIIHNNISRVKTNEQLGREACELMGHRDVKTTMIYTHVLNRGGHGVKSPLDRL